MTRGLLVLTTVAAVGSVLAAATLAPGGGGPRTVYGQAATGAATEVASNWSGYVATGLGSTPTTASASTTFKNATGTWRQPAATCSATGRASATAIWVGLGGYSTTSTALEQAGTSADCSAAGKLSYYAWYELVPEPSITIKSMKVLPGDLITASVVVDGAQVLLQVKNRTRKTVFTKRLTLASPDLSSAEWIAEAPSECTSDGSCRQVPLANFASVTFTNVAALATTADLGDQGGTLTSPLWQVTPIRLVPDTQRYYGDIVERPDTTTGLAGAKPFGLTSDGRSFGVKWVANAAA